MPRTTLRQVPRRRLRSRAGRLVFKLSQKKPGFNVGPGFVFVLYGTQLAAVAEEM